MKDFRNLKVWEKAHQLSLTVYQRTREFPKDELYGLTSQIRRASFSIGANIAEGCGKDTDAELKRYLQIAMGSSSELENYLILAHDLKYVRKDDYEMMMSNLIEIRKMLNAFIQKLKASR
ncbi:MAG TPA: four helix bundle protein [Bacteroidota bacterium]|nr:four helix bundle protein [Bacteroidota bacterium]